MCEADRPEATQRSSYLFPAPAPLDGIIHTLELGTCFELGRPHVEALAASLPQLRSLVLRSCDIGVGAWSRLGTLPALEKLIIFNQPPVTPQPSPSPDWGYPASPPPSPPLPEVRGSFQPEHLAFVAASLSHPLVLVVPPGGSSLDTLGCNAN